MFDSMLAMSSWMLPEQASTVAGEIDRVFEYIFVMCLIFFVIIAGLMFYFMFRYRAKTPGQQAEAQVTHHTSLEIAWSVIPGILLVPMFWWGFDGFLRLRTVPANSYEIGVVAFQWAWEFHYPGGIVKSDLHVPANRPVRLIMESNDVLHAFFVPEFRVKRDVVPGRIVDIWFEAIRTGTFPVYCAEYCGQSHSEMVTTVTVYDDTKDASGMSDFDRWLETADPLKALEAAPEMIEEYFLDPEAFIAKYRDDPVWGKNVSQLETPAMIGEKLYKSKACITCHTIDGSAGNGPTFKSIFEVTDRQFTDGTTMPPDMTIEEYIRESILEPAKRKLVGYSAVMPKITLSDAEIRCIIAFLKQVNEK